MNMEASVSGIIKLSNFKYGFKVGFDSPNEAQTYKELFLKQLQSDGYAVEVDRHGYHDRKR